MLIALLVLLGVDLLVIVGLVVAMVLRRRWLGQHGAFKCRMRVTDGTLEGLSHHWRSGRVRWVHDVLVFSRAPLLFASWLLPVDKVGAETRRPKEREVNGLGETAAVGRLMIGGGAVELAVPAGSELAPSADFGTLAQRSAATDPAPTEQNIAREGTVP